MIQFTQQPLTQTQDASLKLWLNKGEQSLLRDVIESRIRMHQAVAANAALDSLKYEAKEADYREAIREAARLKGFLDVLDEIKDQTEPFVLFKLKN